MRRIYPSAPFVRVRNSRCAVYILHPERLCQKNDSTLVRLYNVCSLSHAIVFAMKTRWYNGQTGLNTRWKLILWIFHKTRAVVFCDLFLTWRHCSEERLVKKKLTFKLAPEYLWTTLTRCMDARKNEFIKRTIQWRLQYFSTGESKWLR